mgnify:CR=1 FL=1
MIYDFLAKPEIEQMPQVYISYFKEIHKTYLSLFTKENLQFRSPGFLDGIKKQCDMMFGVGLAELQSSSFETAFEVLEYHRIATRLYAGDFKEIISLIPGYEDKIELDSQRSNLDQCQEIISHLQGVGSQRLEQFRHVISDWSDMVAGASPNTVWIPLVEDDRGMNNHSNPSATIQPLEVEVELRRREAEHDLIFFNNHPMENSDLIYYQALDAVTVAKNLLKVKTGNRQNYFRIMFGFPSKDYFYTGESFGLGMTLAVLAQMQKVTLQRIQHQILNNVVVTGGLGMDGKVRGISEVSLPAKIEAFIYSPFQTLIHPETNRKTAEEILNQYDLSGTDALAVDDVSSVIKNDKITQKLKISFNEWSQAHLKKNQILSYVATLVFLICLIGGGWYISRDINPVMVQVEKNILKAMNGRGKVLWAYEMFPSENIKLYESDFENRQIRTIIKDFNGDGLNEITYSLIIQSKDFGGHLVCLNARGDRLWDTDLGQTAVFGSAEYPPPYLINRLDPVQTKDGELRLIAVLNHHPWFPSKIAMLTPEGEVLSTYYHGGHIAELKFLDVSGDGQVDLVFAGTNNETRDAVLGVLELSEISGHSPQEKKHHRHSDSPEARHLKYLRFPKGTWIELEKKSQNFAIHDIDIAGDDVNVTVNNRGIGYFVIYQFSHSFEFLGAGLADQLVDRYLNFHKRNVYDDFTQEQIRTALGKIESWNGKSWIDYSSERSVD